MTKLIDVVNFNADASCLSSQDWMEALRGGADSAFCRWLSLYAELGKKLTLGLVASTVVDLKQMNPESLDLINRHPDVFELIIRPFSHDIALLRGNAGFCFNVTLGKEIIEREFKNVTNAYLPPEFMLTNTQVKLLGEIGVESVFINSARFPNEIQNRIPKFPYMVMGVGQSTLKCFPVKGECTFDYLHCLHHFDCGRWNQALLSDGREQVMTWRDGESVFLIDQGIEREKFWLEQEDAGIQREQMNVSADVQVQKTCSQKNYYRNYPIHSFSAWMEGFRMLGYVKRVADIEEQFDALSEEQKIIWLHTISSDILSSVEKKSPQIQMKNCAGDKESFPCVIQRKEKGFEGEEYLYILEQSIRDGTVPDYVWQSPDVHLLKLRNKIQYLRESRRDS